MGVSDDPAPAVMVTVRARCQENQRRSPGSEYSLRSRQMRTHLTRASFLSSGLSCRGFFCFFFLQPNRFLDWRRSQVITVDIEGALLSDP